MNFVGAIAMVFALHRLAGDVSAQQQIVTDGTPPNGTLEVAYRQLGGGKLSDSVHLLTLLCWGGDCSMTTLTLNQCYPTSAGLGFFPKIERTTTQDGHLSVLETTPGTLVAQEKVGGATFRHQFTYSTTTNADLSKAARLRSDRWFYRVTGFSGGAVKYSEDLKRVLTWELVPIRGHIGATALIEPKCKIAVQGISPH